jgi:hypothetical protein
MGVSGQLHSSATLPLGKEPPVSIGQGLGGPQSWSGHCGLEKNLLPLPGIEPGPSSPSLHWQPSWCYWSNDFIQGLSLLYSCCHLIMKRTVANGRVSLVSICDIWQRCCLLHSGLLLGLLWRWRWWWYVFPKCWLTFTGLHGVISLR